MPIQTLSENIPGFLFIDHLAIAVPLGQLEAQVIAYQQLGFQEIHREEILDKDQVREVLLQIGKSPNLIQLLEPLNTDSPVQKWMDRQGGKGGMTHVGFRVRDIHHAFEFMKNQGFQLIDAAPRPGSRGTTVFFVHPKSKEEAPFGILLEVVYDPHGEESDFE